jgi:hypothetical protein
MRHRSFLGLLPVALLTLPASSRGQAPAFDPDRLLADVQAYYELGVHRTAYPGDAATSEWLASRFREMGLEVQEHTFPVRQFFLDDASIEDARGRIEAFPVWLPRATAPDGLRAPLVLVDEQTTERQIAGAVAWLSPKRPTAAAFEALDQKAVAAGAVATLRQTSDGAGNGILQAINAERRYVDTERPVPTLIFGAADSVRLRQSVGREITVRLTGHLQDARAASVLARRTVDPNADWFVVSTPSSGWFTVAGERGPGIAMLLALAEWVSSRDEPLNYLFVATSGHELDYLGARLLHDAHLAPPPDRTRAWLHLGAQIATPPWHEVDGVLQPDARVTTGTLQASPELASVMRSAFSELPMFTLRTDTQIGEFRDLTDHGYRGLGIVGGSNPWFHVPGDDPRAVSGPALAAVTSATARALLALEKGRP